MRWRGRTPALALLLPLACWLALLAPPAAQAAGDAPEDWSPLEAGHGNWSAKQLKKSVKKLRTHDAVMVGFSGQSCQRFCRQFEPIYDGFAEFLSAELPGVKFMRLDADKHKAVMAQYGVSTLPEIITLKKGHKSAVKYTGVHSEWALRCFALKLVGPTIAQLTTEAEVSALLDENLNATVVTGFFKPDQRESDEYEDWLEAAKELSLRADILLADIAEPALHAIYRAKPHLWFDGSKSSGPALILHRPIEGSGATPGIGLRRRTEDDRAKVELETLTEGSIERWVDSNRIPACGALDPLTFEYYERLGLPMLLLFLSKDGDDPLQLPAAEKEARENFCAVARKYRRVVSFLYGDGKAKYREKKKVLGLHGDALPAMAMNTADGRVLTYDATEDFSELALESWVRRYLGEDVKAATKGAERGADSPRPPKPQDFGGEVVVGDAHADAFAEHVDNVTVLDTQNFNDVVMNPHKDVLLILQAHDSKHCQEFYKYVKRSTDRFIELGVTSIEVAKFDVEKYVIPGHIPIQYSTLPAVVMFPARDKDAPYIYMTGKAKAQHLMFFAQEHASFKIEFPNEDPHLTEEQYVMKQQQLKERAEHIKQQEAEAEAQRAAAAEEEDDDCAWADGCDDDGKEL